MLKDVDGDTLTRIMRGLRDTHTQYKNDDSYVGITRNEVMAKINRIKQELTNYWQHMNVIVRNIYQNDE